MTTITKEEFETLPDSLKPKFKADGDSFALIEEDVEGLKKNKQDILEEKKRADKELEELRKFKADYEAEKAKQKLADLEAQGEYEKALKEKEKAWKERFDAEESERKSLLTDIKRERLTNELVKRGALADRAGYLVGELDAVIDLVKGESGYQLQKKGGIGDAAEFDSVIEAAKQKTPFFFAGSTQAGGGATGSGSNSGNAKTITRAQYEANPAQYAVALGNRELSLVD